MLHWDPVTKDFDNSHELPPTEVLDILPDTTGEHGGVEFNLRMKKLAEWEARKQVPEDIRAEALIEGPRGGNVDAMYYNLLEKGLAVRSLPSDEESEVDTTDPEAVAAAEAKRSAPPGRVRHVTAPMSRVPTEEELANKKALEEKAFFHQDYVDACKAWRDDFKKLLEHVGPTGYLTARDADDTPQRCEDRGAAIKTGKEKAKAQRRDELALKVAASVKKVKVRGDQNIMLDPRVIQMQEEIQELKVFKAGASAEIQVLKESHGSMQTAQGLMSNEIGELKKQKDELFAFLCKEEAKSGRLEGELGVLRMLFQRDFKCQKIKTKRGRSDGSEVSGGPRIQSEEEEDEEGSSRPSKSPNYSSQYLAANRTGA